MIAALHVGVERLKRFRNFAAMYVEAFLQYHYLHHHHHHHHHHHYHHRHHPHQLFILKVSIFT